MHRWFEASARSAGNRAGPRSRGLVPRFRRSAAEKEGTLGNEEKARRSGASHEAGRPGKRYSAVSASSAQATELALSAHNPILGARRCSLIISRANVSLLLRSMSSIRVLHLFRPCRARLPSESPAGTEACWWASFAESRSKGHRSRTAATIPAATAAAPSLDPHSRDSLGRFPSWRSRILFVCTVPDEQRA